MSKVCVCVGGGGGGGLGFMKWGYYKTHAINILNTPGIGH